MIILMIICLTLHLSWNSLYSSSSLFLYAICLASLLVIVALLISTGPQVHSLDCPFLSNCALSVVNSL